MLRFLKQMLQLILSPARGWEDIASSPSQRHEALRRGLMPLIAIAALSVFCRAFYMIHPDFRHLIPIAVVCFLQYFLTYYLSLALLMSYLPRITGSGGVNEQKLSEFLCFSIGMMVMIGIIDNLLPMTLTLVEFLPLYVAVVMYKGHVFMEISNEGIGRFIGASVFSVIVPIYLIEKIMSNFI